MAPKHAGKLDYDQITDNVYIGTNMCCMTHFKEELLQKGITADLSLEEERVDAPFGVDFYLWLPTKDHFPPSREQLDCGVSFLKKLEERGKKVYIHCKNGHGRAPTVYMAYLILEKGMTSEQALTLLKQKRTGVHLHEPQTKALQDLRK
jgi:protein-tyrosine phosphatase